MYYKPRQKSPRAMEYGMLNDVINSNYHKSKVQFCYIRVAKH